MTGTQGFQGISGLTGPQGRTGPQGLRGGTGTNGLTGNQGVQGLRGGTGTNGLNGLTGTQGFQGVRGLAGLTGNQGVQGLRGGTGTAGINGTTGTQGFQGNRGINGLTGTQGPQGNRGMTGINGLNGLTGNQGFQGIGGLAGLTGTQGFQGRGRTGAQGESGLTGIQGFQGLRGVTGPSDGPQGAAGLISHSYIPQLSTTGNITLNSVDSWLNHSESINNGLRFEVQVNMLNGKTASLPDELVLSFSRDFVTVTTKIISTSSTFNVPNSRYNIDIYMNQSTSSDLDIQTNIIQYSPNNYVVNGSTVTGTVIHPVVSTQLNITDIRQAASISLSIPNGASNSSVISKWLLTGYGN